MFYKLYFRDQTTIKLKTNLIELHKYNKPKQNQNIHKSNQTNTKPNQTQNKLKSF